MSKAKKINKNNLKLNEIDGIKFRMMWSTKILYSFLTIVAILLWFISFNNFIRFGRFWVDYTEVIPLVVFVTLLMLLLSVLNNKFLGPIVAVIDDSGIYSKDGLIQWRYIDEVCYKIKIPFSRSRDKYERYCYLEIKAYGKTHKILHAPHKMLRYIKKHVQANKIKKDKEFLITFAAIFIFLIVSSLFKKF